MVNNSTNINKTNNHWTKKTMAYDIGNPGPGLGQAQKCLCSQITMKYINSSLVIGMLWFEFRVIVLNDTFNNISDISWRLVLLVEETGVPRKNHRPVASHWQTLSHNAVSSTSLHEHGGLNGSVALVRRSIFPNVGHPYVWTLLFLVWINLYIQPVYPFCPPPRS